ncbi:hypothetical protein [Photobacterium halotolerans]|uniref:hypothetical protein n=1 Tax=Photobacterium halotolerans TaxID=265726 RepID=UPI000AC0CCB0|nr:hypothetical protein [Photobacterium halotolerans]
MAKNAVARANEAMMSGKKIASYDLPKDLKLKIHKRRYSQEEINSRYAAYRSAKAAG